MREQRCGPAGVDADPHLDEPVVRVAQRRDRSRGIARDELDHAGEVRGLEQAVAQPQLLERRPRRVEHRAGDVEPAAECLQHGLAAHRRRLDRGRRRRDAQQSHDVETASTGPGDRARTPQRGAGRGAEDRGDAAAVVDPAGGAEREVQLQLGVTDPAEPSEQNGTDLVGLGLTGPVAQLLHHLRGAGRGRFRADETIGIGEADELRLEARRPRAEGGIVAGLGPQLLDDGPGAGDVTR